MPLEKPGFVPETCQLADLGDGEWAVIRKSLTRGEAQSLREKLWMAGVRIGMTPDTAETPQQIIALDNDWAERCGLSVKSWSLTDEDSGEPLPTNREGVDRLPIPRYQKLLEAVLSALSGKTPEEAKSPDAGAERVDEGDGGEFGGPAADVPSSPKDQRVVDLHGAPLSRAG